jgi:hypothetical protein
MKTRFCTKISCEEGELLLPWPARVLLGTFYYHGLHTYCWELVTTMACTRDVGNLLLPWPAHVLRTFYYHGLHSFGNLLLPWPIHVLLGSCYYRGLYTCCWEVVTIVACTRAVGKLLLSWPAHVLLGSCYYRGLYTCRWEVVTIVACTRAVGKLLLSCLVHVLLGTCYYRGLHTCYWEIHFTTGYLQRVGIFFRNLKRALDSSLITWTDSVWVSEKCFHVLAMSISGTQCCRCVLSNGYGSHKSLQALEFWEIENINMTCLPGSATHKHAHTHTHTYTHRPQLLNGSFFKPLKSYYSNECISLKRKRKKRIPLQESICQKNRFGKQFCRHLLQA